MAGEQGSSVGQGVAAGAAGGQGTAGGGLRAGAIGVPQIVFFVIAAAAPLGFSTGAIPLAIGRGGIGTPGMFLVTAAILAIFAVGYVVMARHISRVGGLYLFVTEGLGKTMGLGIAFVAVAVYAVAATGSIGLFAVVLQMLLFNWFALDVPWWVLALVGTGAMATLGVLNVELNARVLGVLVLCEIGILLIVGVFVTLQGGASGLSLTPFSPTEVFGLGGSAGNPGAMLAVTIAAFAGFEATVIYAEEARDPARTIRRATFGSIAVLAVLYGFISWYFIEAFGETKVVDAIYADPVNTFFTVIDTYVGPWASRLAELLVVTSWFASIVAFHNATSRYLVALGRDGVIPRVFASPHKRFGSPWAASVSHSVFTFVVVAIFALLALDPYLDLYILASSPAVIGLPFMECIASIAIFAYFWRDRRGWSVLRVQVAPIIAAVLLGIATVTVITQIDLFIARTGLIITAVQLCIPVILLLGCGVALLFKRWRPAVYSRIGTADPFLPD